MANRFINPKPQFFDPATGEPIVEGELHFYENDTLTDKDTFADVNATILNANPVPLNANGTVPNIFYNGTARVVLTYDNNQIPDVAKQAFDLGSVGDSGSGSAFDVWNSVTEYEDGAIVVGSDEEIYRSLQNDNQGNDPTSSPTFWEKVSFISTWNANVTYGLTDIAQGSDGQLYRSIQASNLNKDPISQPTWWRNASANQDVDNDNDVVFNTVDVDGDPVGLVGGIGRTAVDGLVLTGQGSTNDIALKNDIDSIVAGIPTGTTRMEFAGAVRKNGTHPAFFAFNSVTDSNVTGQGETTTIDFDNEVQDQGGDFAADTFTAEFDGFYTFFYRVQLSGFNSTAFDNLTASLVASNATYLGPRFSPGKIYDVDGRVAYIFAATIYMDANDTVRVDTKVAGGASTIISVEGGGEGVTYFGGYLAA